jgi:hypothetical protein
MQGLSHAIPRVPERFSNGEPRAGRGIFPAWHIREKRQGTHAFGESPQKLLYVHGLTITSFCGFYSPKGI